MVGSPQKMVLESIVICVDNSDYMKNEDLLPDRLKAQVDAVQVVIYAKMRSSPENYLGLVSMANNRVLTNLTNQEAKLLADLNKMEVKGSIKLLPSLNVSQLVLKHRPIKHAKCRIIAFVGSPITENESEMVNLGKKFKKENVTVDIVTFGCEPGAEVLKSLIDTLNGPSGTSSSFHTLPPNMVLSDYVVSCGLVAANREYGMAPGDDVDEDEELRRAIEWSMLESGGQSSIPPSSQPTGIQDGNDLSDDEQLRIAIQLSLQEAQRLETVVEDPRQTNNTRTASPDSAGQIGPTEAPKEDSPSPNAANTADPNTSKDKTHDPPDSTSNKETNNPPNKNPNNTNTNPNNSNNHAAAAPSNSDTGKTAADSKEAKKTILTKKR